MQTQTSPVFTVNLCNRSLCVIASSYNVQIAHRAQKSLAKWEINNVNRSALRWAAARVSNPNHGHSSISFPKMFFFNMSAPLVLFLGSDSWWLCQDLIKHPSISQQLRRGFVRQTWTLSLCCVLPHLFQTNDTDSPYLWSTPAHNTTQSHCVFAAGNINKVF